MLKFKISLINIIISLSFFSQGIIINEVSNGPSGAKEWVELLVVGNPANPTAPVDLTGWIVDDNGGQFEGSIAGVGIAAGHIQFSSTYNSVPVGSLIVIYNENDRDLLIPTDDLTDSNGDSIYIIPANTLNGCLNEPDIGNQNYSCTTNPITWANISLRNNGDAIITLNPSANFFHGFCYGDVTPPLPLFPSNRTSFSIGQNGTNTAYAYKCGDWELKSSFEEITASNATPGGVNGVQNADFINQVRNGTLNYSQLDSACIPFVPDTVKPLPELVVPNVFTPNGDGKNDLFVIDSLQEYGTNTFSVYNRWGALLYQKKNYDNTWKGEISYDGMSSNFGLLGETYVSEGTYYYILDLPNKQVKKGFFNVFK